MNDVGMLAQHLDSIATDLPVKMVAIDGCGGAGKSTLAAALSHAWSGSVVIHTDDFASWDEPINWWPRMLIEVMEPFARGEPATFQKVDWVARALGDWETVSASNVIIEGVSSSRAEFRPYLAYTIWVETEREERLRRGLERDGQAALNLWNIWMEAEDRYVLDHDPRSSADLVLNGQDAYRFMGRRES